MPEVRHIWLLVDLTLLEGFPKFFKLKHKERLQEGDQIIKLEFCECEGTMLS